MKHIFYILIALLPLSSGFAASSYEQLFARLNLERPDLALVKAAVEAGDDPAAMELLREHFCERFPRSNLRLKTGNGVPRDAAEALDFRFRSRSTPRYFKLHQEFEWDTTPADVKDSFWLRLLLSMNVLKFQADMYIKTGNVKYAEGCVRVFQDWQKYNPVGRGAAWSVATAMTRAQVLAQTFARLVQWPELPPADQAQFLNSIADHGDFMMAHRGPGNQDAANSGEMIRLATQYPEFCAADDWLNTGYERVKDRIFQQVLPDGSQIELTSGYHVDVLSEFTKTGLALKRIGLTVAPEFWQRLEKMYEFCMIMMRPDGKLPTNGDSGGPLVISRLLEGADLFQRPDMKYVATYGRSGTPPTFLDGQLPDAGYYTLRSSWTNKDALYLFLDVSRRPVASHQYFDCLHLFLFAYGRDFFPATGTFSYGTPEHEEDRSTKRQNTVTVDNSNQTAAPGVCHSFFTSSALSFIDGAQPGGYPGIEHRRQILFVRPDGNGLSYFVVIDRITGTGQHTVDQYFYFPPGKLQTDAQTAQVDTQFATGPNLRLLQLRTEGLETQAFDSAMHPGQGRTIMRPAVRFRHVGELPQTYVTLLVPYPGPKAPALQARVTSNPTDDVVTVDVSGAGIHDQLFAAREPGRYALTGDREARAGLIRQNESAPTLVP